MTFTRDPNAVLDYAVDWSRWLAGDEIATSDWTVPAPLTKVTDTKTTTKTTVWLSGGVAGESYTVTNRIVRFR
jgi:hypothetical protein